MQNKMNTIVWIIKAKLSKTDETIVPSSDPNNRYSMIPK